MSDRASVDAVVKEAIQFFQNREFDQAEKKFRAAIWCALRPTVRDRRFAAVLRTKLAIVLDARRDYDGAERMLHRALTRLNGHEDREMRAGAFNSLGVTLWRRSPVAAGTCFRQAIAITEGLEGDQHEALARVWRNLGLMQHEAGWFSEAIESLTAALRHSREEDKAPPRGAIFRTLANVYQDSGQYQLAAELYDQALKNLSDARGRAQAFGSLATLRERTGDITGARAAYKEAAALIRKAEGPREDLIPILLDAAVLAADLGDPAEADSLMRRAARLKRPGISPNVQVNVATARAHMAERRGQLMLAVRAYRKVVRLIEALLQPGHPNAVSARGLIGALLQREGRSEEAVSELRQVIATAPAEADWELAKSRLLLASMLLDRAEVSDADTLVRQVFLSEVRRGSPELRWQLFDVLVKLSAMQGRARSAIFFGKIAVHTVQQLIGGFSEADLNLIEGYRNERVRPHRALTQRLVEFGRLPEAEIIHRMEREVLLDELVRRDSGLNARRTLVPFTAQETTLLESYETCGQKLRAALAAAERRRAGLGPGGSGNAEELEAEATAWLDSVTGGEGDVRGAAAELSLLDECPGPGIAHLQYLETEGGLTITVQTQQERRSIMVPGAISERNRLIHKFRTAILTLQDNVAALGQTLFTILIEPIEGLLADVLLLKISATGALQYLPFAALHDGSNYLPNRWSLAFDTAVSPPVGPRSDRRAWRHMAFGFATGPHDSRPLTVHKEFAEIGKIVSLETCLGAAFTASGFARQLAEGSEVVHIGSHFEFEPARVERSRLALGDGTWLSLAELRSSAYSFAEVELLILSACNSGTADVGDLGPESLAGLAQLKGARTVLATLWPVADASATALMPAFYAEAYQNPEISLAEALSRAQLVTAGLHLSVGTTSRGLGHIKPRRALAHPFYWAGYVLFGDWR